MSRFSGAVDETNDGEYLAFIICDSNSLTKNMTILPQRFTHIADIFYSNNIKQKIINDLDFSGNVLVCCIKFGIPQIRYDIYNAVNKRKVPQAKYRSKVSYRMRKSLNTLYDNFLNRNNLKITDIYFQVDNEVIKRFLMEGGLKCVRPIDAHKIADCIAYANLKKWELNSPNIIERGDDFKEEFRNIILKDIGL